MSRKKRHNSADSRDYRQKRRPRKGSRPETDPPPTPNWATVDPVPRNRLLPGTVVWAHVDFVDGTGEKARPVVVIDVRGHDVVVLPGTTSARRHHLADHFEVEDRDSAGLRHPTGFCTRPRVVARIDVTSICGELADDDRRRLLARLDAPTATLDDSQEITSDAA